MKTDFLELRKRGRLFQSYWSQSKRKVLTKDVTENAPKFLFEDCEIQEGVLLRDIFLLLMKHLDIFSLILQNWCTEIVHEGLFEKKIQRKKQTLNFSNFIGI